jgi:hypothetical protein
MAGAGVGSGQAFDAHTAARYSITVAGAEVAVFSDLVDLTSALDPSELPRDDDRGGRRKKRAGRASVTLKRGQNNDMAMFTWHRQTLSGEDDGRDAVLSMFATDGSRIARYNLETAWPATIEITGEKPITSAAEILYETVTFACRGIERVSA